MVKGTKFRITARKMNMMKRSLLFQRLKKNKKSMGITLMTLQFFIGLMHSHGWLKKLS